MKKLSAVLLAVLMALTCLVPMASAYDATETASTAKTFLDWVDAKIAGAMADFNAFKNSVGIDLGIEDIDSLDDLLAYKDHAADLEGDFANLDTSALKTRAAGDVDFINSVIDFMAANKDIFKKVFTWTPGEAFDYGKVGEYIMSLEDGNEMKDFYVKYLKDGYDIQTKFVAEIAREMGYTIPEGEKFDDTLNNGIKEALAPVLKDILKTDASKAAYDAFNLKTTDVYTLVKAYVGLLQNDYKGQFDSMLASFLSALQGMVKVVESGVNVEPPVLTIGYTGNDPYATYHPADPDFNAYMPTIYVNDKAYDTMKDYANEDLGIDVIKNGEMPEADAALVAGAGEAWGKDVIINATGADEFLPEGVTLPIKIKLDDIENAVKTAIVDELNGKGSSITIPEGTPMVGGQTIAFNISDAQATFSYKAYKDVDSFAVQVKVESATAKVNITSPITATADVDLMNPDATVIDWGSAATLVSMAKSFGLDADAMVINAIKSVVVDENGQNFFADPAFATVVVNNLDGKIEELEQIKTLLSYIDTDAAYNYDLLDVSANYDAYKGVVGQVNHILYDLVDMICSDAGMADLALVDGDNSNLTSNLQKICTKVSGLLDTMKQYIDRDTFVALAETADISAAFASEHGFNAGMIYDMDFSSVENALDCGIRVACDLLAEDDPDSIFYEFHMRVEDLDTLDAIAATTVDMVLGKLLAKVDIEGWDYTYTAIDAEAVDNGTVTAKDAVMDKIVDILYSAASFAVPKINEKANELLADLDIGEVNFQLGVEKGANWEATLNALLDRFIDLTDGLFIKKFDKSKNAIAKLSDIAGEVLPMTSMFSNYAGLEKMNEDFFVKAADGDLGNFLAYFEVKDDAIAGNTPVTKALINASDKIVSAFFPTTVSASTYEASETVQDYFTGYQNDPEIAARNMQDIADRKADLVPCALNLLRESGLELAMKQDACAHDGEKETVPAKEATCTEAGYTEKVVCAICGKVISESTETPATGHNMVSGTPVAPTCTAEGYTVYTCANGCGTTEKKDIVPAKGHNLQLVDSKDATCTEAGYKKYACANGCGETKTETINAKGHSWSDWKTTKEATEDEEGSRTRTCSVCGATETQTIGKKSQNFFQRIISTIRGFFQRIINFFKNLF